MRILIAGAGYIGLALATRLAPKHEVFALRRSPPPSPLDGVEHVDADLTTPDALGQLPPMDAVVITVSADGRTEAAYRQAYVDSISQLRHQLDREGFNPKRWLFTSSTAVYGNSHGGWLDEDASTDPEGFAGRTLLRGEQLVLDAPWDAVVLRLGGIYGPGRTRLLDEVISGESRLPAAPTYTNRIHRDDAAGALEHLLFLPSPAPVYNVVDDDPAERSAVLLWLASRVGAPPPPTGESTATRGNKRIRNARLRDSGYVLRYPTFREGYEAIIAERGGAGPA